MKRIIFVISIIMMTAAVQAQDFYKVQKADFCTDRFNEFSAVPYKNGVVYSSDKTSNVFVSYSNLREGELTDMYFVRHKGKNRWAGNKKFPEELMTHYIEGPAVFTPDGEAMYYTKSIDFEKKYNNIRGDSTYGIFTAELKNGKWTHKEPFKYNSKAYNTGFPSVSQGGDTLFFASQMPGGKGGFDIWFVTKSGRGWGKAVNMETINTPDNEVTPFVHASGRLYFSSNGYHKREDTDILYTDLVNDTWTEAKPLIGAFNSASDDFGFTLSAQWDTGYFSSDRKGSKDIYLFYSRYPTFEPSECTRQKENNYCYHFFDQGGISGGAAFQYEWDMGDGNKIRGLEVDHCYEGPGQYLVQLNVVDSLTGEVYFSQASYEFSIEDAEQPYIHVSDTVIYGSETTLDASETFLKNFEVEEYYWDLNYGEMKSGEKINYTFPYPGTYNLRMGVTSVEENDKNEKEKRCVTRKVTVIETTKE